MIKQKIYFLLLLLSALFMPYCATAATYKVGVENTTYYPLYEMQDKYTGILADILNAFAQHEKIELEYIALPVARLFNEFLSPNSTLDFKYPDNPKWQGELKQSIDIAYSNSVMDYIDGACVKAKNADGSLSSFNKLAIIRGFTPWDYLSLINAGKVKVTEVDSVTAGLKLLQADRVDGLYVNIIIANYQANKLGMNANIKFNPKLPHTSGSYYLSSIKHKNIIEKFNIFLKNNTSLIASIKSKYNVSQ